MNLIYKHLRENSREIEKRKLLQKVLSGQLEIDDISLQTRTSCATFYVYAIRASRNKEAQYVKVMRTLKADISTINDETRKKRFFELFNQYKDAYTYMYPNGEAI